MSNADNQKRFTQKQKKLRRWRRSTAPLTDDEWDVVKPLVDKTIEARNSNPAISGGDAEEKPADKVDLHSAVIRKPITVWERFYKDTDRYEFNHIEDGHSANSHPMPIYQQQKKAWGGADGWRATFAYLDESNKVVYAGEPL